MSYFFIHQVTRLKSQLYPWKMMLWPELICLTGVSTAELTGRWIQLSGQQLFRTENISTTIAYWHFINLPSTLKFRSFIQLHLKEAWSLWSISKFMEGADFCWFHLPLQTWEKSNSSAVRCEVIKTLSVLAEYQSSCPRKTHQPIKINEVNTCANFVLMNLTTRR